jgi:phosphoglycolate phosphatase-like HAD superfamily hydrolase
MREFLRAARDAGIRLGLCTNRSDSVHRVLRHFDLSCFDPVVTVTQAPPKPDPAGLLSFPDAWGLGRKHIGYVGDSLVDQQAGDAAGIPFIAFKSPALRAALHVGGFAGLFRIFFPAGLARAPV